MEWYFKMDQALAEQQDALANRMSNMAFAGKAEENSDEFQKLMSRQKELCMERAQLINELNKWLE